MLAATTMADNLVAAAAPLQATPAAASTSIIIQQLTNRVLTLEKENADLRAEVASLRKRPAVEQPEPSTAPASKKQRKLAEPAAPLNQLDDKAKNKLLKNWGSALARNAKQTKFYNSYGTEVLVEDTLMPELFTQMFWAAGKLIQPTPENKPKSQVTIRTMQNFDEISAFFGATNISKTLDCHAWQRGGSANVVGGFGRIGGFGFGFGRMGGLNTGFQKAKKLHKTTASVSTLEIQYNKSNMKLQLKFICCMGGGSFDEYDSDDY